jgi:hypothetical protein
MTNLKIWAPALLLVITFAITGCTAPKPLTDPTRSTVLVEMPPVVHVSSLTTAPHGESPQELMQFGLALGKVGRHQEAGDWLMETASMASDEDAWAIACCTEAAYQFLLADNRDEFLSASEAIRTYQGRWTRLAPGPMTGLMLGIADLMEGNPTGARIPTCLTNLEKEM